MLSDLLRPDRIHRGDATHFAQAGRDDRCFRRNRRGWLGQMYTDIINGTTGMVIIDGPWMSATGGG